MASDSTIARVLGALEEGSGRRGVGAITQGLRSQGYGKLGLPDQGRTRVGAVDGSSFGGLTAIGFATLGTLAVLEDLEPGEQRG